MRVIDLAVKDLTQIARDRMSAVFLLIMPVVFTLMFGFAFGGFGGQVDPRLPVAVIDEDGSRLSAGLLGLLDQSSAIRRAPREGQDAETVQLEAAVQEGDLAAAIIVPAGYGPDLLAGGRPRLAVIAKSGDLAGQTALREIQAAAMRMAAAVQAAQLSAEAVAARGGEVGPGFVEAASEQALQAWQDQPLTVATTESGAVAQESSGVMESGFSHISPAMMVQFAMAGLIPAADVLVTERTSRALRRLLTTATSRVQIILGHWLAMFAVLLAQLVVLTAFGQLLRVDYMRQPLAVALLIGAIAFWTASLGLLIGVLAKRRDQVIIFALVPMFVLGGMGGAWMPLEVTGRTFQAIGHLLPTAWAMDGLENIVIRGLGLESIWLPLGVMLAFGVVLFGLAVWRFRFE
jgi:ABC-2 type transport system permease protein